MREVSRGPLVVVSFGDSPSRRWVGSLRYVLGPYQLDQLLQFWLYSQLPPSGKRGDPALFEIGMIFLCIWASLCALASKRVKTSRMGLCHLELDRLDSPIWLYSVFIFLDNLHLLWYFEF